MVKQIYENHGDKHRLTKILLDSKSSNSQLTMTCYYPKSLTTVFTIPERVELLQTVGDSVELFEKTQIRIKSLNSPISAAYFTIETANLPPGTPIVGSAIPSGLIKPYHHIQWNGRALVAVNNSEIVLKSKIIATNAQSSVPNWFGARTFIGCGLIILFVAATVVLVNVRHVAKA